MKTHTKIISATLVTSLGFSILAHAANLTWDADSATAGAQDGSGTWDTTTTSWWTGSANASFNNATPDVPTFGAGNGAAGIVTLGAPIVSGNITFSAPGAGNYTIAGGGFTLGLTNRTIIANANATISAPIAGGSVTLGNSVANAPMGTLTLSAINSFTGGFTLGPNAPNATCAVRVTSNNALGTGTIGFNSQGNATSPRLELAGGATITNAISLTGRNNSTMDFESLAGANTLSGPITPGAGGVQYGFAVDGSSTLTLAGTTTVQTSGGRTILLRGTGNGIFSGTLAGGAANSPTNAVSKTGPGTWALAGANTFIGPAVVGAGTLTLDYTTQNNAKLSSVMPLYMSGGTISLNAGSFTEVVGSTLITGGAKVSRASGTGVLRQNSLVRSPGGTIDYATASIADTDTSDVNGILGGYATLAGADWAHSGAGASDTAITAYTVYTDIGASGSTVADGSTSNVRLNSAGGGGNIALAATTTTVNTLLQNTTTAATIDTGSKTLRLGATGGVLVPSGKQGLTFGTAANSGTLTAGGADNTAGEIVLINNSANDVTVNSTIADNGSGSVTLTKSGSGTATLNGNNTYTGTNYVVGGTLNISGTANLGNGTVVINGGTLNVTATTDLSSRTVVLGPPVGFGGGTIGVAAGQTATINSVIPNNVSGLVNPSVGAANSGILGMFIGGSLTKVGNGTLVLGGANSYGFGTIINAGTISITASGNLGTQPGCYTADHLIINGGTLEAAGSLTLGSQRGILLGPVDGSGGGTFQADDSVALQLDSRIADNWNGTGSLTKTGNGMLVITSPFNDYSGNTTVSAGTLQLNNSRALPSGAGKGNLSLAGTLSINGVSVALNGLSGSGTVDNITGTPMTFTVGNNNQGGPFNGVIQNSGGGALALAKTGSGTLTLTAASTYSGSTIINNGVLALSGSASVGASTNIAVGTSGTFNVTGLSGGTLTLGSSQTLSGSGAVIGTISDSPGAIISPGASAGTLTVGNLNLNGGGTLNFDLANVTTVGSGVNDLIVVTGTLNIPAESTTLNLNFLNGIPAATGKYTLFQYGSFSGSAADIVVPTGFTISNNVVAKTIELLINHIPANLTWRGDGAGDVWDVNSTPNWIQSASPQVFNTSDSVTFDDTGSNLPPIFIASTVFPASTVVNATKTYDFTGGLIGSGGLTKSGGGTLILENDNQFLSGGIISGGTLQIGNNGASGSIGGGTLTNNTAIVINRSDDTLGVTNSISGSGTVSLVGPGGATFSGSNSYAGLTSVSSGILHARSDTALGATNSGTVVANGAQLFIDRNINVTNEPLSLTGVGPGSGALHKGGAGATAYTGPVTLTTDSTINVDGGASLALNDVRGPGLLTKDGGGALTLSGSNTLSGILVVTNGNLIIASNNALGSVTNIAVFTSSGGVGISGTRITVGGGTIVSNTVFVGMPSTSAGDLRSSLYSANAGVTNTWNGPIALTGVDGNVVVGGDSGTTFVINGSITNVNFAGGLRFRGVGTTGLVTGAINLGAADVSVDDGSTWTFASGGNSFSTASIVSGTLKLGANNAIPTNAILQFGTGAPNTEAFDLAGFNQRIGNITIVTATARTMTIGNSSTTSDSLLTLDGANASTIGAVIQNVLGVGTRKVSLTLTNNASLTLTNVNTYSGDTTVASGTLLLSGAGSITNSANIFVAGGAVIDVSSRNDTTFTVSPVQTLKGNGSFNVNGSLTNLGTLEFKLSKSGVTLANDLIQGLNQITYGGTLHLVISGNPLTTSDSFQLFNATTYGGAFTTINPSTPGSGLAWDTSTLAADGILRITTGTVLVPPSIKKITISGTNVIINGTNNAGAGGTYHLLTSTNIAVPLANWTVLTSGSFDANGNFSSTNATGTNGRQFYIMQVP